MEAVHLFAASGYATFVLGCWIAARAGKKLQRSIAERAILRQQLEMLREAMLLVEYGARDEARDLIDCAINIKPVWEIE